MLRKSILVLLVCASAACIAQAGSLSGRVVFPDGTAVAGAKVRVSRGGTLAAEIATDVHGVFVAPDLEPGAYHVTVEQDGLAAGQRSITVPQTGEAWMEITVALAARRESVTVTATLGPQQAAAIPSSVVVFDGERLRNAPGITLDDALRSVPGFSLFRRTSSIAAHPTTQGVSLRGIGPSGASRSLVMADGFPINDPFGGWVYWNRIPREALAAAEVLRGAASAIYGNAAMAGVASLFSERPQRNTVRASITGGTMGILTGSWFASTRSNNDQWGISTDGESFRNDGYFAVRERERGAIDTPYALTYTTARARVERRIGASGVAYFSGGILSEDRNNGTRIQTNATDLRYGSVGTEWRTPGGSTWRIGAFAQGETFRSNYSSIARDRNTETFTLAQRVPSNSVMARFDWSRKMGRAHVISAGGDVRWVEGDSYEATPFGRNVPGGRQWNGGFFGQDIISIGSHWQLVLNLRVDRWTTKDFVTQLSTDATVVNPQFGFRHQLARWISLRAQGYRGFRAPTLNELYRRFQVGNVVTLANPQLQPERTNGGEAGGDLQLGDSLVRVTGFWTELREPVSNVTLITGATIIRQRQNVGRARIRGVEADLEWRPRPGMEFRAGYLFDAARVARFSPDPRLEGKWLPQVPRHKGFASLDLAAFRGGLLRLETRLNGLQYDDDRNELLLGGFAEAGASYTQPMGSHLEWFVRGENLLNRRYIVARTPFDVLSGPAIVQGGVRIKLRGN